MSANNMNDLKQYIKLLSKEAYSKKLIYGTQLKKYNNLIDKKTRKSKLEKAIDELGGILTSTNNTVNYKTKKINTLNHLSEIGNFQKKEKNNNKVCIFKVQ